MRTPWLTDTLHEAAVERQLYSRLRNHVNGSVLRCPNAPRSLLVVAIWPCFSALVPEKTTALGCGSVRQGSHTLLNILADNTMTIKFGDKPPWGLQLAINIDRSLMRGKDEKQPPIRHTPGMTPKT